MTESDLRDAEVWYVASNEGVDGGPASRVWRIRGGDFFRFRYADGVEAFLDREGARIWLDWPQPLALDDVMLYLMGNLLGFAQRLRGVTCLHASSIRIGQQAIALIGPAGAGKSSNAAGFFHLGHAILADDVTSLFERDDRFYVRPAHERVWLRPDVVRHLFGAEDALPRLTQKWEKRCLELGGSDLRPGVEPMPLVAIYKLGRDLEAPEPPELTPMQPRDALLTLVANTYVNFLLDPRMRSEEFQCLGRLAKAVPMCLVRSHGNPPDIRRLCERILVDVRERTALAERISAPVRG
ncbi:MAG: hypothetical protein WA871_14070 [Candidatus Acidiferrales bacterium]